MKFYLERIKQNKLFIGLLIILLIVILIVIFGRYFAPHDPLKLHYDNILENSSKQFPMGTDHMGRCVFSRILYGGRSTLLTIFTIVVITSIIGTIIGISSALAGGVVDTVIMRFIDMLLAFPGMIFIIALVAVLGVGYFSILIAMSALGWMKYARVSRALALEMKTSNFMAEARLGGAGHFKLITKYIFPNLLPHILVIMTQDLGSLLLTLSSLSLLGLGSQPPAPEWGSMLSEGKPYMQHAPWLLYFPGLVISIHVIIFNLLGDSLRDILDPRQDVASQQKGRLFT